ncbi:MAG: transglutaminase domain-containing protein [Candidatus Nanoarchaeia archaeon]|nr:transglutaminase domain-containing protein [Candidatus Nanoarchaeia archaeon]
MDKKLLKNYLEFSMFTNPGLYRNILKKLPNEIDKIGYLVRKNFIHRTTLAAGNIGTNKDKKFGDMNKVPWYRQPEDDYLVTVPSILAELYRRDKRGFIKDRSEKNKLVLTCRFIAILMASILKCKGIPCRVRAGHAPYFEKGKSGDHWINQYWNNKEKRWITLDVDGSWSLIENFDPYDIPKGKFDFPAEIWLNIREGKEDANKFWNASGDKGLIVVAWSLFYDFHCLMNNEVIYSHLPPFTFYANFPKLSEKDLKEIDKLAELMKDPDKNFNEIKNIWENKKEFRLLKGGLL